ncbi:MAG: mucoidy inhibitor MuiA family protein [Pseudomonadota bacterium]
MRKNKHLFLTIIFCSFAVGSASADEITTEVSRAIVYPSGATVTRTAPIRLAAGSDTVTIVDLPPGLDAFQIRLSVADPSVRLGQVQVSREARSQAANAAYRAAERAAFEQRLVLQALTDEDEAAERELTFLRGFAEGYSRDAGVQNTQGGADPAAWRSALTLLREGTESARARLRANQIKRIDAERELERLESERRRLGGRGRQASIVTVDLESASAVDTTLSLTYETDKASWSSIYEARVDSRAQNIRMNHIASVEQTTGEDWEGVELVLSTQQIDSEAEFEWPESKFVSLYDPNRTRDGWKPQNATAPAVADVQEIIVTGSRLVTRDVGAYGVTYAIPGRVSIEDDADSENNFDIDRYETSITLVTAVAPVTSSLAFLEAQFNHTADAPIQGGDMRAYLDGTFVGERGGQYVRPGEKTSVSLGVDPLLEVRVLPQGDYEDEKGVIRKRRFETEHTIYEFSNRRSTPTQLEVYGRYPVSENRQVEVEIGDDATPPAQRDVEDQPGIVRWDRELAPQETWRITQQYTVSYPEDQVIDRDYRIED